MQLWETSCSMKTDHFKEELYFCVFRCLTNWSISYAVISPPHLLHSRLSLALLTWAICMDCSIRRLDGGADRQQHRALQDNDTTPKDPDRTISRLPLSRSSLSASQAALHDEAVMLADRLIHLFFLPSFGLSFSLSLNFYYSFSPRHALPFRSNSENYNPWFYRRMWERRGPLRSANWAHLFLFFLLLIPLWMMKELKTVILSRYEEPLDGW